MSTDNLCGCQPQLGQPAERWHQHAVVAFPLPCARELATAILRRKQSPNRLMVDDATNDDNSVISLHTNTMEKLQLFRGDTVLVKGKKRKDTVLVVLADDTCDENKVRLNKGTRSRTIGRDGTIGDWSRHSPPCQEPHLLRAFL